MKEVKYTQVLCCIFLKAFSSCSLLRYMFFSQLNYDHLSIDNFNSFTPEFGSKSGRRSSVLLRSNRENVSPNLENVIPGTSSQKGVLGCQNTNKGKRNKENLTPDPGANHISNTAETTNHSSQRQPLSHISNTFLHTPKSTITKKRQSSGTQSDITVDKHTPKTTSAKTRIFSSTQSDITRDEYTPPIGSESVSIKQLRGKKSRSRISGDNVDGTSTQLFHPTVINQDDTIDHSQIGTILEDAEELFDDGGELPSIITSILLKISARLKLFLQKYYIFLNILQKYHTFENICKNTICNSLQPHATILATRCNSCGAH
ncbi:uncharacterized protein LOC108195125 [Daucus carota subsp. sativus]|uniref:uncharacterized protein LOC108195125 n=1 Tax=Daucus carota subsp. sativus TaxID=79200 RepID=UPI0007EFE10B|nr:PREDICTED: uncharacterized protein LOC108195125 [Daucus carota subsp. sativus]